jgi:hypothetical protein
MTRKGSTDEWMLVRRAAEYELGFGPDGIPEGMFRYAAAALRKLGYQADGATLDAIAGTSAELDEVSAAWRTRYDDRPLTAAEKSDLDLLGNGSIRQAEQDASIGIDGAWYCAASLVQATGAANPGVVVTTLAPTVEIVTGFRDEDELASWLADRQLASGLPLGERHPGGIVPAGEPWMARVAPLSSSLTGPDCRTVREERVLAWLLQHGDFDGEVTASLRPQTFWTYSRSEIYEAWRTAAADDSAPTVGAVRNELAMRLLRAPGWAARHVGWPFGQLAGAYFDRLAVTTVAGEQAKTAARTLVQEDTAAMILARKASHGPSAKTHAAREAAGCRLPELQRPNDPSHRTTTWSPRQ